ncbi:MAG: L,D-transpeptidase family protein [Synergistaceae bacterium]|nr:L,D-transpeptidase family protein [Synergistaceae bacterium]
MIWIKKRKDRPLMLISLSFVCLIFIIFFSLLTQAAEAEKTVLSSDLTVRDLKEEDILWLKIVKNKHKLYVMRRDEIIKVYDISTGKNSGQKERSGDNRTPEGEFEVQQIQNAANWQHDFNDGKGMIKGAYGPLFIRINCGWRGIGIHGTHDPDSIGKNVTEGCIRLRNQDLKDLRKSYIRLLMKVVIVK